jgi:hypothetical protein
VTNFGILARQRVQVLPLLFVLLCVPRRAAVERPQDQPVDVVECSVRESRQALSGAR